MDALAYLIGDVPFSTVKIPKNLNIGLKQHPTEIGYNLGGDVMRAGVYANTGFKTKKAGLQFGAQTDATRLSNQNFVPSLDYKMRAGDYKSAAYIAPKLSKVPNSDNSILKVDEAFGMLGIDNTSTSTYLIYDKPLDSDFGIIKAESFLIDEEETAKLHKKDHKKKDLKVYKGLIKVDADLDKGKFRSFYGNKKFSEEFSGTLTTQKQAIGETGSVFISS